MKSPSPLPVLDDEIPRHLSFRPPRRRWPGLLAVGIIGIGIAAAAVTSFTGPHALLRQVEQRLTGTTPAAGPSADAQVAAAVKAALATDPALAAAQIEVSSEGGVVRLDGPAPDDAARERAQVLAATSPGVARVDNRLVVLTGDTVTR